MANHRNSNHTNPALEAHYADLALSGHDLSGLAERQNPRRAKKGENGRVESSYARFADDYAEQTGQFK